MCRCSVFWNVLSEVSKNNTFPEKVLHPKKEKMIFEFFHEAMGMRL